MFHLATCKASNYSMANLPTWIAYLPGKILAWKCHPPLWSAKHKRECKKVVKLTNFWWSYAIFHLDTYQFLCCWNCQIHQSEFLSPQERHWHFPSLCQAICQQRLWKSGEIVQFLMTLHHFSACHSPIFMSLQTALASLIQQRLWKGSEIFRLLMKLCHFSVCHPNFYVAAMVKSTNRSILTSRQDTNLILPAESRFKDQMLPGRRHWWW